MNYYFDTEFIDDGKEIHLISIGIVSEDGREFYAELDDSLIPWNKADDWVLENIRPLLHESYKYTSKEDLATDIWHFVHSPRPWAGPPLFWAYYANWDWVVFLHIFGKMLDAPANWPMFCMDIKQLAMHLGNPILPNQKGTQHDALEDARWNREAHQFLRSLEVQFSPL